MHIQFFIIYKGKNIVLNIINTYNNNNIRKKEKYEIKN